MKKGGVIAQLPNDTRWNSQIDCVKTFIKNYPHYLSIREGNTDSIDDYIRKILDNSEIHREAINLNSQLEIVGIALDKLLSDSTHLADI
ncbi:hypothetical protein Anas_13157 [Armadillidium nasatum]|uniref:Uncharacterized protein n=1 Tax=Armadillidium nasatum TaxID=96803 RepID=A0A5N5T1M8_9CRUS|nr:hypothetical protein Anas_13157 [Armadillidium nasatum]